jgi:hypothetical protein
MLFARYHEDGQIKEDGMGESFLNHFESCVLLTIRILSIFLENTTFRKLGLILSSG